MLGVYRDAGHRAQLHALGLVKMAHAFGAFVGVDLVDFLSQGDGLVRALGLTHIAVDALIGNKQRHLLFPSIKHNKPDIVTVSGLIGKLFAEAQL